MRLNPSDSLHSCGEFCEYCDVLSQSIDGGNFLNISELSVSFKRSAGSKFKEHTEFCTE